MTKTKEPWTVSITHRFKKIKDGSNKKSVIYIDESPHSHTFRYRIYNVCQAINYSKDWVASYFFQEELPLIESLLPSVDLVVFSRVRWSFQMETFYHQIKKYKIPVGFDIDDLVFNVEKIPLIMSTIGAERTSENYNFWFSYVSRLWKMGDLCDFYIATNVFLAQQLENIFKRKCYVLCNFLNEEQILTSEEIVSSKTLENISSFKLGYFSGSPSHKNDFGIIAEDLAKFLKNHPQATLEVVGHMEFPEILEPYIHQKQVFHSPIVDFLTLQRKIAAVDINLVPLVKNEFTHCKSELKFFEAAIVKTLTCATPTFAFEQAIQANETGFLCDKGEWLMTLEKCVDPTISHPMLERAKDYCLNTYTPQKQCANIENVYQQVLES